MSRSAAAPDETRLTASQIQFAQRMLPFRYSEVVSLSSRGKSLLFAELQSGATYSELHMAAGERAVLRLSHEVARLRGALVLIDEVEVGLHPRVQQLLMLQLQQLALRNDLQIIVTTHSPVILDSVPPEARIFLDRDEATGRVSVCPPYRDIVQDALYGRSGDTLNILCEDEAAEAILWGVLDVLGPRHSFRWDWIRVGRNTGAEEFPTHAAAFEKFGRIDDFVFVLDGDKRHSDVENRIRNKVGDELPVLFLPGDDAPEIWVWNRLRGIHPGETAEPLIDREDLARLMSELDSIFDSASDSRSQIAKTKLRSLGENLKSSTTEICRSVARAEARHRDSDIGPLVEDLENVLQRWRAQ